MNDDLVTKRMSWLRRNRVTALLIVLGIGVIGLAQAGAAIENIYTLYERAFGDTDDMLRIPSVTPSPDPMKSPNLPVEFQIRFRYRLASAEKALLVFGATQYPRQRGRLYGTRQRGE
jgi:hypothetical protein